MNKDSKLHLLSPLFLKYQADFEKNPRSRVFAPLGEVYRKLGMIDKAMEILSKGIRFHPSYVMGYLGLAFCYFDLKQFNLAYSSLRPLIEANRDNLRLQKLFSDVCLALGKDEEALETLKYLLFINPRNKEIAESMSGLEKKIESRYRPKHQSIVVTEKEVLSDYCYSGDAQLFDLEKLDSDHNSKTNYFDDWLAIDLSHDLKKDCKKEEELLVQTKSALVNFDHWNVRKGSPLIEDSKEIQSENKVESSLEYHEEDQDQEEEYQFKLAEKKPFQKLESEDEILSNANLEEEKHEIPLVTHTLVDLYCGQGHNEKALEILDKILIFNPNDQKTIEKIKEIKALVQPLELDTCANINTNVEIDEEVCEETAEEEDGHHHLMNTVAEETGLVKIEEDTSKLARLHLEEKLSRFLKKIQKRALDYQGRV